MRKKEFRMNQTEILWGHFTLRFQIYYIGLLLSKFSLTHFYQNYMIYIKNHIK